MSKVFGFDDLTKDFNKMIDNAQGTIDITERYARKIQESARKKIESYGLVKTGDGLVGITIEKDGETVRIGWAERPNFHLYFHELGFHALDNRHKQKVRRGKARKRIYNGVRATWIEPHPHLRPAHDELAPKYLKELEDKIHKK